MRRPVGGLPRAHALREDPELIERALWRLFEVEGGGEVSLTAPVSYSIRTTHANHVRWTVPASRGHRWESVRVDPRTQGFRIGAQFPVCVFKRL